PIMQTYRFALRVSDGGEPHWRTDRSANQSDSFCVNALDENCPSGRAATTYRLIIRFSYSPLIVLDHSYLLEPKAHNVPIVSHGRHPKGRGLWDRLSEAIGPCAEAR